jgi:hypothetical protein
MAQVFGWYKTCDCMTSNWAWGGGYLDFKANILLLRQLSQNTFIQITYAQNFIKIVDSKSPTLHFLRVIFQIGM